MKILQKRVIEAPYAEAHIRAYGIRKLARDIGISNTKILRAIRGMHPLPESDWQKMLIVFLREGII